MIRKRRKHVKGHVKKWSIWGSTDTLTLSHKNFNFATLPLRADFDQPLCLSDRILLIFIIILSDRFTVFK